MSSKFARNEPCPCGSGKKYKYCHGAPAESGTAETRSMEMQYRFTSVILSPEEQSGTPRIVVNGELSDARHRFPFLMVVEPKEGGNLVIRQFGWQGGIAPAISDKDAVARQLLDNLARCLDPLSVKADEGERPGALVWRPLQADDAIDALLVTLRPHLSRLPAPAWETLWDRIELKRRGDAAFAVPGFESAQVETAFAELRKVFTPEWLEQRFRESAEGAQEAGMAAPYPHDAGHAWFPAFHLSRLAMGVICRDPALNNLVDLGLALDELQEFAGLEDLRKALAADPRLHHQAVLAAELFGKGWLSSCSGEGELKAIVDDQPYLIRSVEVSLETLAGDLQAALQPRESEAPVVLHAVVNESSWYKPELDLPDALEELELPARVFAVVIGRRFLDAGGGRLKRNAQKIIYNDKGVDMPQDRSVEKLFAPNYESYQEPALNVGSYFYVM